jgi:hypothetical protein
MPCQIQITHQNKQISCVEFMIYKDESSKHRRFVGNLPADQLDVIEGVEEARKLRNRKQEPFLASMLLLLHPKPTF